MIITMIIIIIIKYEKWDLGYKFDLIPAHKFACWYTRQFGIYIEKDKLDYIYKGYTGGLKG